MRKENDRDKEEDSSSPWYAVVSSRRALEAAKERKGRAKKLREGIEELQRKNHFSARLKRAYLANVENRTQERNS